MQALIDALKTLIGDLGDSYNMVYAALAYITFLVVFFMVLSAVIRIIDRR